MSDKILTCWGLQSESMLARLRQIKLIVFDVDGTLTAGGIYLNNTDGEYKQFFSKDGYGIAQAVRHGIRCAVITGRKSHLVERRCAEIYIDPIRQGIADKKTALDELKAELGIEKAETASIGDDLNDLPMFAASGFTACPADAHPYMQKVSDLVLSQNGGHGAARELTDLILIAQGKLTAAGGPV